MAQLHYESIEARQRAIELRLRHMLQGLVDTDLDAPIRDNLAGIIESHI